MEGEHMTASSLTSAVQRQVRDLGSIIILERFERRFDSSLNYLVINQLNTSIPILSSSPEHALTPSRAG